MGDRFRAKPDKNLFYSASHREIVIRLSVVLYGSYRFASMPY